MRRALFFLLVIVVLSSCSQLKYIAIETYNPSDVTFPDNVRKILIVNNALPQPEDSGCEFKIQGVLQDTCKANADSALFYACRSLGETIFETDFFYDVVLFHDKVRTDNSFLFDKKLTKEEVNALCDETDTDAVISFDRLVFDTKKSITTLTDGIVIGVIDIEIDGIVRAYLRNREAPLATVMVGDSIFWAEETYSVEILNELLPKPDEALKAAGSFIGNKIHTAFVPHWNRDARWYYTGTSTPWKQASAFASNEKWEDARERWSAIHDKSSGWKAKAKTASNIALSYELTGDLDKALEWAKMAYDLYKDNNGEEDQYTQLQNVYKDVLINRQRADKKLNMQFGEV